MINDELIQRFFTDQCTPEEAALVADYLRQHLDVLERYFSESEFATMEGQDQDLPATVSAQWLEQVHRESGIVRAPLRRVWVRRLAAAALIGGIVWGIGLLFRGQERHQLAGAWPDNTIPVNQQERKENKTTRVLPVAMPDGSTIRMMPSAIIVYNKKFSVNRDVYLEGEADFEVASDAAHTFTVYSGEVSTQVLGTTFRVKSLQGEDTITVRLNKGKVLVKAEVANRKTMQDVSLNPGQELRYSKKYMTASVRSFLLPVAVNGLVKAGTSAYKGVTRPDWYKFSNQPMKAVLDQLSNYYGVTIYYYPSDIAPLYFDGKFERTDSLEKILTDITLPNNLRFVRDDSGYTIRKR